ncbi:hypothetical protein FD09_GL000157 [Schleiferilactobacillus perolens DSM 12744]|uniref:ROK family protein n=2 Tax=Schleiferilactobacillus perolens TaxID=100468 RepID=A0A0R1N2S6_9LACO|nr:hypothetical protein FD09_GL000157 [Schleiferilactobacillus perolens DSM 12744]
MIQILATRLSNTTVGNVRSISISTVGRVDIHSGVWHEIDPKRASSIALADDLAQRFNLPVYVGNDVYCATLAELQLGMGQQTDEFIYLNVGTGIAGRVVSRGKIIVGAHNDAGEIGHMVVDMDSHEQCVCGRYGCVEPIASGLGMSNYAKKLMHTGAKTILQTESDGRIGAKQLFDAFDKGDLVAQKVINRALKGISTLILNLIRVSDPEAVVLGGGVTNNGWLLSHLQPLITPYISDTKPVRVVSSAIDPNHISLIGAGLRGF